MIFLLVVGGFVIHISMLDGLDGFLLSRLFQEDTVYAEGYTDEGFRQVHIGMSETEVRQLLGDPLETYMPRQGVNRTSLQYSRSPGNTHYRIRAIFIRDGRVISKKVEFWVD